MRRIMMPGLALAGGVLIAAILALLLIGDGQPNRGGIPEVTGPTATRLLPGQAGRAGTGDGNADGEGGNDGSGGADGRGNGTGDRGAVLGESAHNRSAAESQYLSLPDRGAVIPGAG